MRLLVTVMLKSTHIGWNQLPLAGIYTMNLPKKLCVLTVAELAKGNTTAHDAGYAKAAELKNEKQSAIASYYMLAVRLFNHDASGLF